ncbi:hypothetical protein [Hymenobacter ruricola]|uniref:Outer membrane protein beta-barrel domain-containing protein n=1 Tax=Hymenobacter ruricola TaxID=2791023 RepID=A0ABS0IAC1_9BACT|nr:hypothetical protein [Hymenobacter ruricola]MBF9223890.1 hypothetical protein [Hymenobacter ruricola]
MMEEPEENRLDHSLRSKFEDYSLEPSAPVWAGIEPRIGAPVPAKPRLPLLFGLVALLSGLAGWLLPHADCSDAAAQHRSANVAQVWTYAAASGSSQVPSDASEAHSHASETNSHPSQAHSHTSEAQSQPSEANSHTSQAHSYTSQVHSQPSQTPSHTSEINSHTSLTTSAAVGVGAPGEPGAEIVPPAILARADSTPATLRPLAALERQVLVQLPSVETLQPGTPPAESRAALLLSLRAERAELLRLQRRTDSTLLALGDLPGAPQAALAATSPAPADTARPRPLAHRWSLLLTAAPEQNTLGLQGPEGDSLTALRRNHETGRSGLNAALMAEYRLTPRLSVGGGMGFSTYGADVRITNQKTDVLVKYDTATTRTTTFFTSTNQTYSVRIIQVPQLNPIFNSNSQVIGYDTVYVPRQDTVYTTTVQHDSIHSVRRTITPLISKKETTTTKLLQPTYRFFTVPVLLRYRLTPGTGRWWADVSAGAQLQFFLGGTQVVTQDGRNFRSETIGAGEGPFRRLNVALTGSLALNYALTNRISLSVAPSLRWQALSLYRPETGLRQQPTATGLMFGLRFGL